MQPFVYISKNIATAVIFFPAGLLFGPILYAGVAVASFYIPRERAIPNLAQLNRDIALIVLAPPLVGASMGLFIPNISEDVLYILQPLNVGLVRWMSDVEWQKDGTIRSYKEIVFLSSQMSFVVSALIIPFVYVRYIGCYRALARRLVESKILLRPTLVCVFSVVVLCILLFYSYFPFEMDQISYLREIMIAGNSLFVCFIIVFLLCGVAILRGDEP